MALETLNFLSKDQIKTDKDSLETYGKDWTKHIVAKPLAIVFPKTTEEVQKLVLWARKSKTALVPSGGRTGLSGAAIATNGEIVVSLEKMNKIISYNAIDETISCEAGVITEQLQDYAKEKGKLYPVDFAARGSSQIGGNVATNAGGIKVVRYGLTRDWVAGMTVVTGQGEVLKLNNALVKNASGYDLRHLFIGSEGTLGFITELEMKVTQPSKDLSVFVFGVPTLEAVMNIFEAYKTKLSLTAFEMFTDIALKYVVQSTGLSKPFETGTPYYVLVEVENQSEKSLEDAMSVFEHCMEQGWVEDGTVSQNAQQAKDLWRLREDISEATSAFQPYKNDVSVRISQVPEFLTEMDQILKQQYPDIEVVWFGHIGDGNLHINMLKPKTMDEAEFLDKCQNANDILFKTIQKHKGSISAEHGVGLTKKPYLHYTRSEYEILTMKAIKKVFDPDGILNPGKVF